MFRLRLHGPPVVSRCSGSFNERIALIYNTLKCKLTSGSTLLFGRSGKIILISILPIVDSPLAVKLKPDNQKLWVGARTNTRTWDPFFLRRAVVPTLKGNICMLLHGWVAIFEIWNSLLYSLPPGIRKLFFKPRFRYLEQLIAKLDSISQFSWWTWNGKLKSHNFYWKWQMYNAGLYWCWIHYP